MTTTDERPPVQQRLRRMMLRPPGEVSDVPTWQRVAGGLLVSAGALQLAVLECFLIPLYIDAVPVPLAVVLAVVGNVAAPRLMYVATAHRMVCVLPVALWLIVTLVLASRGPGGDLVVPGTVMGLAFLFLGTIAGAFAAGQVISAHAPRRTY